MCYVSRPGTMSRLYISQKRLDAWNADNRVAIDGDVMTLVELDQAFFIQPAVRVLAIEGMDEDPNDLVGKVKDEEELVVMGADHLATSLIYKDAAYKVENGFVGNPYPKNPGVR